MGDAGTFTAVKLSLSLLLKRVVLSVVAIGLAVPMMPGFAAGEVQAQQQRPLRVALYGDSIGEEFADYLHFFVGLGRPVRFDRNTFGGTNACDWFDEARRDAATFRPDVVVVLFTGNTFTPCMQSVSFGDPFAVAWKTAADTNRLASIFPRADVYRVGFARTRSQQVELRRGKPAVNDLINFFLSYSSAGRWRYVDGAQVLMPGGVYRDVAPCSVIDPPESCRGGVVRLRSDDGVHLCPTAPQAREGRLPRCVDPSPGASRLALAVAGSLTRHL